MRLSLKLTELVMATSEKLLWLRKRKSGHLSHKLLLKLTYHMIYFLDLKNGATEFINPVTSFKAYLHDISFEHAVFLIFSPIIPWFVTFGFTTITWQIPEFSNISCQRISQISAWWLHLFLYIYMYWNRARETCTWLLNWTGHNFK